MFVNYSFHQGQANAGTFKLVAAMQTLEYTKQFITVFYIKANAVVFYIIHGPGIVVYKPNFYFGLSLFSTFKKLRCIKKY